MSQGWLWCPGAGRVWEPPGGPRDSSRLTYDDDLHGDGHPDLLHVLEVELLDNDQEHSTDQGIDQGGHVGLGQAFTNVNECLKGREEKKVSRGT